MFRATVLYLCFKLTSCLFGNIRDTTVMHEKAKCVCFIYMQPQKTRFKSVQINMKQVSYIELLTQTCFEQAEEVGITGLDKHFFERTIVNIFVPISFTISFEYPQHMLRLTNKKIKFLLLTLIKHVTIDSSVWGLDFK